MSKPKSNPNVHVMGSGNHLNRGMLGGVKFSGDLVPGTATVAVKASREL